MSTFYDNADQTPDGRLQEGLNSRQHLLRDECETWLREQSEAIDQRRVSRWQPDYASLDAYAASLAPNRERWQDAVGRFPTDREPGDAVLEPFLSDDAIEAWWVTLPWHGVFRIRAVLALPRERSGKLPLVLAQHGIGSSPEKAFGFLDNAGLYASFARKLATDGYAVIAPMHLTEGPPRGRLQRMCLMLGGTLFGLEMARLRVLLDWCCERPEIDPARIGMWGLSLGGAYTLMYTPLEPRIKVAISAAWFNHRVRKMVIDDKRHSCFLSTTEEHVFIPNWLTEFSDQDLMALIAPRPFMAQSGKCDGIAWWPWLVEEFEAGRQHYEQLGCPDHCVLDLHEAGHEIRYESGLAFLRQWL
jgi:dienelactone hydrolase